MGSKLKIYVAGPLGFSEAGRKFHYESLIPAIKNAGYKVLNPWVLTPKKVIDKVVGMSYGESKKKAWRKLNSVIGTNNEVAIRKSHGMVAVLDGPDVDSGTAAEIGFAYAFQKPILGYRGDFRLSADNEGGLVNLQVEYFIRRSGGTIITQINDLGKELKAIMGRAYPKRPR